MRIKFYLFLFYFSLIFFPILKISAQTDTLKVKLPELEQLFLQNNLSLIAQNYNIQSSKALIDQAKYWDNPNFSFSTNVYDDLTNKFFSHNESIGSYDVQLQQLIKTAGKRGKLIQLAKDDQLQQEITFKSIMQNLRYDLRNNFHQLSNLIQQGTIYDNEINALGNLITSSDNQLKQGNVSVKDNMRLKALLFGLHNDRLEITKQVHDLQADIKTQLNIANNTFIYPIEEKNHPQASLILSDLFEQAKLNSPSYLLAAHDVLSSKHQITYQKSLAIPDVNLTADYNINSSYAPKVYSVGLSIPLPIFNQNKGNIRSAEIAEKAKKIQLSAAEIALKNDIQKAWLRLNDLAKMQDKNSLDFYEKYDLLMQNMIKSYKERQISLVEFTDFMDTYKETKLKILQQILNYKKAQADLNFAIGQ